MDSIFTSQPVQVTKFYVHSKANPEIPIGSNKIIFFIEVKLVSLIFDVRRHGTGWNSNHARGHDQKIQYVSR